MSEEARPTELLLRAAVAAEEGVAGLHALAARLLTRHASSLPAVLEQWANVQAELGRARDQALSELRLWLHQQEKAMEGAREAAASTSEQLVMFSHLLDDAAVRGDGEELITSARALLAGASLTSLHCMATGWVEARRGDVPTVWKLYTEALLAGVHIGGPGAETFLWSDCATAAEHNTVAVACEDEDGNELAWIQEEDVSVSVTGRGVLSVAVAHGVITIQLGFDVDAGTDAVTRSVTVDLLGRQLSGFPRLLHCAVGIRGRFVKAFSFPQSTGQPMVITVTDDGKQIVIPYADKNTLEVWNGADGQTRAVCPPELNCPISVCATPRNTVLVSSLEGRFVAEVSLEGKLLQKLLCGSSDYYGMYMAVATNGDLVAVGRGNGVGPSELVFANIHTGHTIRVVQHPLLPVCYIYLCMAATGACLIADTDPGLETATGRLILVRGHHVSYVPALPERAVSAVFADPARDDVLLVLDAAFCVSALRTSDGVVLQRWDCWLWLVGGLAERSSFQLVRAGPLLCVFACAEETNAIHTVVLE